MHRIITLSSAEFDRHVNQSPITYSYYRIAGRTLEVLSTPLGIFQARFIDKAPHGVVYGVLDELKAQPLVCKGTPFQLKVWHAALSISEGATATYQEVAARVGSPRAYRAVGTALGNNRVCYLIPCHRVVKTGGDISGYRWGRDIKKQLLADERK